MNPPLLFALFNRLRANAGDYGAISRALAEAVCEIDGATTTGVYLRDYAGETLFLAGQFPNSSFPKEDAPRLSAEGWDDPVCYCLHTGNSASFTRISELPESVKLISTSPYIRSYNVYPIPELSSGGMGCVLALYPTSSRGRQAACQ